MKKIGYFVDNEGISEEKLKDIKQQLNVDKVFIEQQLEQETNKPVLSEILSSIEPGDVLVVKSIEHITTDIKYFLLFTEELEKKRIKLVCISEQLDTSTEEGKKLASKVAAFSIMEREYKKRRRRQGIERGKQQGVYKGRKKIMPDPKILLLVYNELKKGTITTKEGMKLLNLRPSTYFRRIRELRESMKKQEGE